MRPSFQKDSFNENPCELLISVMVFPSAWLTSDRFPVALATVTAWIHLRVKYNPSLPSQNSFLVIPCGGLGLVN